MTSKLRTFSLTFPTANMDEWDARNRMIHEAVGFPDAAGTDLQSGERDMSWYDLTLDEANTLRQKVRKLGIEGLKTSITEVEEDGTSPYRTDDYYH